MEARPALVALGTLTAFGLVYLLGREACEGWDGEPGRPPQCSRRSNEAHLLATKRQPARAAPPMLHTRWRPSSPLPNRPARPSTNASPPTFSPRATSAASFRGPGRVHFGQRGRTLESCHRGPGRRRLTSSGRPTHVGRRPTRVRSVRRSMSDPASPEVISQSVNGREIDGAATSWWYCDGYKRVSLRSRRCSEGRPAEPR